MAKDKSKQAAAAQRHYENNKDTMKARARLYTDQQRERIRTYLREYLEEHPCVDCGLDDLVVLEFDHLDPATKKFCVGSAVTRSYGLATVKTEVEKCDVRCANCHRRKTYAERGFSHRG